MADQETRRDAEAKLHGVLESVCDETTFCKFLQALSEDWFAEKEIEKSSPSGKYGPGPLGWENGTIGDFLGAASVGLHTRSSETNPWQRAARIIWLGKIYE